MDNKFQWLHISLLSLLIYLVVFLKMDTYHIRWWDESMFVVNTYEMLHNGKYFSLYYNNMPDLINTKPPMMVWIQLLFVKLLGYNEIAVRLPSAIAAAATVFIVFIFIKKRFGSYFAWMSALILLTSHGYIGYHTSRTADSDSLLTFFTLVSNLYFIRYIEEKKRQTILLFFLFITLAFATKMYAGLLFIPAYLIILIRYELLRSFTFNSQFLLGILFFLTVSTGMIYLRELDTPGYFQKTVLYDVSKLYNSFEAHEGTWDYYLDNLNFSRFSFWFIPLLLGVLFSFLRRKMESEKILFDLSILITVYLIIISSASTKLVWYDMPLYPYLSILAAYGISRSIEMSIRTNSFNRLSLIVLIIIFSYPYWSMFRKSQANIIPNGEKRKEAKERFLFLKSNSPSNMNGAKIYFAGWNGSLLFYKYKFFEKGENIELTSDPDFKVNDRILVSEDSCKFRSNRPLYFA